MTELNALRLDGIDYELSDTDSPDAIIVSQVRGSGTHHWRFVPKEIQVGWICFNCKYVCECKMNGPNPPVALRCSNAKFEAVYKR